MDGQNDLKKLSSYIGIEKAKQLQSLRLGEFFYDKGTETKLIKTEKFRSHSKPNLVTSKKPFIRQDTQQEPEIKWDKTLGDLQLFLQVGAVVFLFAAFLYALSL